METSLLPVKGYDLYMANMAIKHIEGSLEAYTYCHTEHPSYGNIQGPVARVFGSEAVTT